MNILRRMEEVRETLSALLPMADPNDPKTGMVLYELATLSAKVKLWEKLGSKTFILSKELVEAFQHTDVPLDIKPSEFHYPFHCFIVESDVPLFVSDGKYGSENVFAILYINSIAINTKDIRLLQRDGTVRDKVEWDISLAGLAPGVGNVGLDQMWINLKNGDTMDAAYKNFTQIPGREMVNLRETQALVNIFFNTIMYINDVSRVVKETEIHGTKKTKIGKGKKATKSAYILLMPPQSYKSLSKGTGRTIDKRFIVRGHWTRQAYGKGRLLRKRIWIKPYWKGPELSEVVSKPYKVK